MCYFCAVRKKKSLFQAKRGERTTENIHSRINIFYYLLTNRKGYFSQQDTQTTSEWSLQTAQLQLQQTFTVLLLLGHSLHLDMFLCVSWFLGCGSSSTISGPTAIAKDCCKGCLSIAGLTSLSPSSSRKALHLFVLDAIH